MRTTFPIVFEREANGVETAYVVGLPVYAAADTRAEVETAIVDVLGEFLEAHPNARPGADFRVASVRPRKRLGPHVRLVGAGALLASRTSRARALASRANGRKGGRPSGKVAPRGKS